MSMSYMQMMRRPDISGPMAGHPALLSRMNMRSPAVYTMKRAVGNDPACSRMTDYESAMQPNQYVGNRGHAASSMGSTTANAHPASPTPQKPEASSISAAEKAALDERFKDDPVWKEAKRRLAAMEGSNAATRYREMKEGSATQVSSLPSDATEEQKQQIIAAKKAVSLYQSMRDAERTGEASSLVDTTEDQSQQSHEAHAHKTVQAYLQRKIT